jgi:phenylalanyl-tRNA synthetase beta chain
LRLKTSKIVGSFADGVVVGKVLDVQPHPNADKLRVCQVDIGAANGVLNIVCGAANVRKEIYVPVATVGTYLPVIDVKIRASKLRGVRSEGMICSLAEVGLEPKNRLGFTFLKRRISRWAVMFVHSST